MNDNLTLKYKKILIPISKRFPIVIVRLNLINHVLALFCDKFTCNTVFRNLVFRWESCKGSV